MPVAPAQTPLVASFADDSPVGQDAALQVAARDCFDVQGHAAAVLVSLGGIDQVHLEDLERQSAPQLGYRGPMVRRSPLSAQESA